jgi:magnesium transporter
MSFEFDKNFITRLEQLIANQNDGQLNSLLAELHPADLADILDELSFDEAIYIMRLLDSETTSDILTELDDDIREKVLKNLSSKEIAEEIDELETDDAADIIAELPEHQKEEVIQHLEDKEHAKDIVDLLRYDEDTAGGLMGKELIHVNKDLTINACVKEMRRQAQDVDKVLSVYVVDNDEILQGRLSLKRLLTADSKSKISKLYDENIISVKANDSAELVAQTMQKYDLFVVPVVDEMGKLIGRITIDDVVDFIKEEADKDYQMAAGLSEDVEADDSIKELIKARLPWLIIALLGGFVSVTVLSSFNNAMNAYASLFFFTPLIAATAGNVGVQSSAIVVQGLANGTLKGSMIKRLVKEFSLSLINGIILAIILLIVGHFMGNVIHGFTFKMSLVVSISLVAVIILASIIGTFVPLILHKKNIDPAVATGPFITTSNDIFGIFIFFTIAKLILGF